MIHLLVKRALHKIGVAGVKSISRQKTLTLGRILIINKLEKTILRQNDKMTLL